MKTITFLADTHTKHGQMTDDLPGGDIIIHAGDLTGRGYLQEILNFCAWFNELKNYTHKIFIAGNHDFGFEDQPTTVKDEILNRYPNLIYLQDKLVNIDGINIYGTPWQPEFYNWAFNLPRNGEVLKAKWDMIPKKTDILITHGPAFGILDVQKRGLHIGCELLTERVGIVKPKIHVFGHNHHAYGTLEQNGTHFINAAVLNEQYIYTKKPITIVWDEKNNLIDFI